MAAIDNIYKKKTRIAILETHFKKREIILKSLRSNGFSLFSSAKTLADIHNIKSSNEIDIGLCIMILSDDNKQHLEASIRNLYADPKYTAMRIFILYEKRLMVYLPKLFEAGVLACHKADWSIDSLTFKIKEFIIEIENCKFDEVYLSARYLRAVLDELENYRELVHLEESFARDFKEHKVNTLELAEAYFKAGRIKDSLRTLDRAIFFYPGIKKRAHSMEKRFLKGQLDFNFPFASRNNIKRVVVVDNDPHYLSLVSNVLGRMGVSTIDLAADSKKAEEIFTTKKEPDLIITEWSFKEGLSGYNLLQRLRCRGMVKVPVVVLSDPLPKQYAQVFRDLSIFQVIVKPATEKQVLLILAWTMTQLVRPTEPKTLERRIISKLYDKEYSDAFLLKKRLNEHPASIPARCKYIDGYFSFAKLDYKNAIKHLHDSSVTSSEDNLDVIGLLGFVYQREGDYPKALLHLEKALKLSPDSVERCCMVADLYLATGEKKLAEKHLQKVKSLDKENPRYIQSLAKRAVFLDRKKDAERLLAKLQSQTAVFGFINNLAVRAVASKDFKAAIKYYYLCLSYMKPDSRRVFAILNYNLGLALVRDHRSSESIIYLKRAIKAGESPVLKRARALFQKVQKGEGLESYSLPQNTDNSLELEEDYQNYDLSSIALSGVYKVLDDKLASLSEKDYDNLDESHEAS